MNKKLLTIVLIFFSVFMLIIFLNYRWSDPDIKTGGKFEEFSFSLPLYDLFDIGVADADDDGNLDVYTLNHSAQQSLLINETQGRFVDVLADVGLSQDPVFYAVEDSLEAPEFGAPGYYIYRQHRQLKIEAYKADKMKALEGTLSLPWPISVESSKNTTYKFEKSGYG